MLTAAIDARPRRWRYEADFSRALILVPPFLWLIVFFLLPFAIIVAISLGRAVISVPPVMWESQFPYVTFDSFRFLLSDPLYISAYLNSLRLAATATLLTLLIGFPMALAIARMAPPWRTIMLMAIIMPFWTSFLLRIYAWMGLLANTGPVNGALMALGLIEQPIPMMNSEFAVQLAIVYGYLPFMVLPLYASLERLDPLLDEAALDLGARPFQVFRDVTLPQSIPGIIAGSMLVFIPATGEYVIPALVGRGDTPMIGKVLADEVFLNRDWPVAAAVTIVLLLVLLLPIVLFARGSAAPERNP